MRLNASFVFASFFLLLGLFNAFLAVRPGESVGLKLDPEVLDFGDVELGDSLKAKITLTNSGNKPLVIHRHIAGCRCTGTSIENPTLPPGKSTVMTVSFIVGDKTKRAGFYPHQAHLVA